MTTNIVDHVTELDRLSDQYQTMQGNAAQQQVISAALAQQVKMMLPILRQLIQPTLVNGPIKTVTSRYPDICAKCGLAITVGTTIAYIGPRGSDNRGPFHLHCVKQKDA